jgi:hypothetical protein
VYVVYSKPKKKFASLEEASAFASSYTKKSGIVVAVEKAKPSKKEKAEIAARIQRAVVGFLIPMLSIPKLYKALEEAVAAGKADDELKAVIAAFPGVEVA